MVTIRKARLDRGWNQAELAVNARVAYATISSMENGKPVTRKTLRSVCAALEISMDEVEGINLYDPMETIDKREAARRESKRHLA